jgi:hypothetical protein
MEQTFMNECEDTPEKWRLLFNEVTTDPKRSFATFMPYAGLGTLKQKTEGGLPTYDQPYELIPTTWTYQTYALAATITEEAQLEDPLGLMAEIPKMLARSERKTKDLLYTLILSLGFAPNVVGSDGLPLFAAAHPLGPIATPTGVVSSIGQYLSNSLGATQLTPEALYQGQVLFETQRDDRGLTDRGTPEDLVCGVQMGKIAAEVLGAPLAPYTANNTPNTEHKVLNLIVNEYLTNPYGWYILGRKNGGKLGKDSHSMSVAHKWQNKFKTWRDPQTDNWNAKTSFRSAYGFVTFNNCVGSQGG